MSSMHNTVHYCCVAQGSRTLYVYSGGDHEIDNMAALCLENTPSYHKWYFETIAKKTYRFLIEDGFAYFTIVNVGLGNPGLLQFLEHVRDEFKKVARKSSRGSLSGMDSITVQEQLVPVFHRLITSLEHVYCNDWASESSSSDNVGLSRSPVNANGQIEAVNSTKAPLLGKSNKQNERKSKDLVITIRDIELEKHRKSIDKGAKLDPVTSDSNNQGGAGSSKSLQKDLGSMRIRSSPQSIRKKWWRQVRIVLAIDVAICLILFVIWLSVCGGFGCTRLS